MEMVIPATLGNARIGTFEGTVTTASGLIDGAIELTISEQGMTAFAGVAGISCGIGGGFVVDFSANREVPVEVADDPGSRPCTTSPAPLRPRTAGSGKHQAWSFQFGVWQTMLNPGLPELARENSDDPVGQRWMTR